jgi:ferredoxin
MTTTYDPFHARYVDEADLRQEMTRVYDLCHGCRLCFKFCTAFPTLFDAVDRHDDQDAAKLTTAEQDQVVDECFNCKLCYVNCPYVPGQHEWALDFPRLMLRAEQVLHRTRPRGMGERITDEALGRTDVLGKVNTALAPVVDAVVERPGSLGRRAVDVYEHNGIACDVPGGQVCCGAPWLHGGDVDNFRRQVAGDCHPANGGIVQETGRTPLHPLSLVARASGLVTTGRRAGRQTDRVAKLTLNDISDLRAYERERAEFRRDVIALKKRRRVGLGEVVTLVFENRSTVRFQVQEMARVEKLISDRAIETELAIYNPLIPEPGQLCATLFVELTSTEAMERWLPRLVGIERSGAFRLADGQVVAAVVDEGHAKQLTREEVTASVHYVRWELTHDQVAAFVAGPVTLMSTHAEYAAESPLSDVTHAELVTDLQQGG